MSESTFRSLLIQEFTPYGNLSGLQLDQLEQHHELLQRWNVRMNLTRIQRLEDAVRLHYCESLFFGTLLPPGPLRIVDVGSGAGFPGIPLAILRGESQVVLIESHQRKAVFLREAARDLPNVRVIASRAEDVDERFDWIVSRAVSPSSVTSLRLAPSIALLIGKNDTNPSNDTNPNINAREGSSGLQAGEPQPDWKIVNLPWGHSRIAALKHNLNSDVPRGTFH